MTADEAPPPTTGRYVSFARRLHDLATVDPDRPALTVGERSLSRRELHDASTHLAHELAARGTTKGDMVTVALPNSLEWFVAFAAAWKLGATPQPVSARLPDRELAAVVDLADSRVVVGVDARTLPDRVCMTGAEVTATMDRPDDPAPLPDAVADAWKAPTSGGSTGRPKLIVSGDPSLLDLEAGPPLLMQADGCLVMPGPLYHNGPLIWSCQSLLWGGHVVVLERFDAEATLAAIESHGADIIYVVPTMMKRISRLPDHVRERYDLASLRVVWHLAEPCPAWLKQTWIDWLGPERIVELYGGTEGQLSTVITGTEWLEHRGSVGRPLGGQVRICDDEGRELPAGEQGEVWLRTAREKPTYRYVGAEARTMEGGWESLGDIGWLDEDGYLYLGDRKQDMILTGGVNVYPAEVEAALQEHPAVHSCAVIGLPDEDRGNVVHAIVEADPATVDADDLRTFLEDRLVRYKIPRSFEFVAEPLRDDAGKVRRSALRHGRL